MKKIILILVVFILWITGTVLALSADQQSFIDSQLANYRQTIANNPELFDTPWSVDMYYSYIRDLLQYKINTLNWVIAQLPAPTTTSTYFCATTKPAGLTDTNTSFIIGTPTSVNQAWQNTNASSPCYYTCNTWYSGVSCTSTSVTCTSYTPTYWPCQSNNTKTLESDVGSPTGCTWGTPSSNTIACTYSATPSCAKKPESITDDRATFVTGVPTISNQPWVKDVPNCWYTCKSWFSGDYCQTSSASTMYTVTYNANGGTLDGDSSYTIPQNSVINYFPSVSKPWHNLDGWYTQPTGGTRFTNGTTITQNITYYAHWNLSTYCASPQPTYSHATFTVGTPTSGNQVWRKWASSCGFSCSDWYTWDTCQTPPISEPTCEWPHPAAIPWQLEVYPYSSSTAGPWAWTANTIYRYGYGSCWWVCVAPRIRNGDVGCKLPDPGSGITVHVIDAETWWGMAWVQIEAAVPIWLSSISIANETTNSAWKTNEFWFGWLPTTWSWTSIQIIKPGYKIRSAVWCDFEVFVHGWRQVNFCRHAVDGANGWMVTITLVRGDIATNPTTVYTADTNLNRVVTSYKIGDTLYGYIEWGDPNNTYSCMDLPGESKCTGWWTIGWRQLTKQYNGHEDEWQINSTTSGDRIEFRGWLYIAPWFPVGTYHGYVRNWNYGTQISHTTFEVRN